MEIFFSDIPDEGLLISGTLEASFFDLKPDDSIRVVDGVDYVVTLYCFEEAVVLSGRVEGSFELQCVTCLEYFPYQAVFPKWQSDLDFEEGQVKFDPRDCLRDDILLALPVTPHCDELQENHECPKVELVEKFEYDPTSTEEVPESDDTVWGALDELKKDQ